MVQVLQNGDLRPQLGLMLVRKAKLVNHLNCNSLIVLSALTCGRTGGGEGEVESWRGRKGVEEG